jgi:hypothetical protein
VREGALSPPSPALFFTQSAHHPSTGNNRLNATFKATQRLRRGGRAPFESDSLLDAQSEMLPLRSTPATFGGGTGGGEPSDPAEDGSAAHDSFKQHVHDVFMHSFSEQMLHDCGIHVHEMSIEDVTVRGRALTRGGGGGRL